MINCRLFHKTRGWENVELDNDFKEIIISEIVNILGGHQRTKVRLYSVLRYSKPQHWGLSRMILDKGRIRYIAGQDYVAEIKTIRNF